MKTIKINERTNCKKNIGFGIMDWFLFEGYEYDTTNFKMNKKQITFSLFDKEGWIGDYSVLRSEFEEKCIVVKKKKK